MGLSWQQGPLSTGAIGRFLVPEPQPKRGCCTSNRCAAACACALADAGSPIARTSSCCSNPAVIRWPISQKTTSRPTFWNAPSIRTQHPDLGPTSWYSVRVDEQHIAARGAWQHTNLPAHASELQGRIAFAWRAMDAFYEEDERILGHAADPYHRIDIRQTSRTSWSAMAAGPSPIPSGRWSSTSPASRRAGTFHAPTSMSPPSLR